MATEPRISTGTAAPMDDVLRVDPPQLAQQPRRRAEAGHDGLQEIEPGESGQQQPPGADLPTEKRSDEDDGASEEADERFGFHGEKADGEDWRFGMQEREQWRGAGRGDAGARSAGR
jgi:hypothetical protein